MHFKNSFQTISPLNADLKQALVFVYFKWILKYSKICKICSSSVFKRRLIIVRNSIRSRQYLFKLGNGCQP